MLWGNDLCVAKKSKTKKEIRKEKLIFVQIVKTLPPATWPLGHAPNRATSCLPLLKYPLLA